MFGCLFPLYLKTVIMPLRRLSSHLGPCRVLPQAGSFVDDLGGEAPYEGAGELRHIKEKISNVCQKY